MPHEIYKRGKVWHYRGTVAGRRLRGSCGTAEKAVAQRIAAEAESRAWKSHLDGPGAHITFAQATLAYLDAEKSTRFIAKIADYWKDTSIREITAGGIKQSAIILYPNAVGATRNRQVIAPTNAIINHAAGLGWCSPIKAMRFPVEAKTKQPVTLEWVEAFAEQASPHLSALCFFMFGTGARIGEAVALTWGDLNLAKRTAKLTGLKPKPWTRYAHLQPRVVAAIANIISDRNHDERVFQYHAAGKVKQVWENAVKRAGIERLTPHCCRHGFATSLLQSGIDAKTVAQAGGWKDVGTVMKFYAHAMADVTVTDTLFGTALTQLDKGDLVTISKQKRKAI
jgi:integrase